MNIPVHKRFPSAIETRDTKDMLTLADYIQLKQQNQYLQQCISTIKQQKIYTQECNIIQENIALKAQITTLNNKSNEQETLLRKAKIMLATVQEETLLKNTLKNKKNNEEMYQAEINNAKREYENRYA